MKSNHSLPITMLCGLLLLLTMSHGQAAGGFSDVAGLSIEISPDPAAASAPLLSYHMNLGAEFACELHKEADALSPLLLSLASSGEPMQRMTLSHVSEDPQGTRYRITLDKVRVTSMAMGGGNHPQRAVEVETVKVTFDRIEVTCFDLDENGGIAGGLAGRYDVTTGLGDVRIRPPFLVTMIREVGRPGVSVSWPAERGHRYQILGCAQLGAPWQVLLEHTATEDGLATEQLPTGTPALFVRVKEVD